MGRRAVETTLATFQGRRTRRKTVCLCFSGPLLHIHAFPWGWADRLLYGKRSEGRKTAEERGKICVCICALGFRLLCWKFCICSSLAGPWGPWGQKSRWKEGRVFILGQVQQSPVGSLSPSLARCLSLTPPYTHTFPVVLVNSPFLQRCSTTRLC